MRNILQCPFPLNTLLWIDTSAALVSAVFVASLKNVLAPLFNLPESLLAVLAAVAFVYSVYGFSLARRQNKPLSLVRLLALANAVYGLACIVLLVLYAQQATALGIAYLLFDFVIVEILAYWEWQQTSAR